MKKNILIFSTAVVSMSLMAFNFNHWNNSECKKMGETSCKAMNFDKTEIPKISKKKYSDFFYAFGSRFSSIKKGELEKKTTINEFISDKTRSEIVSYNSVKIIVIENDIQTDIREMSTSELFSKPQLELLKSAKFSSHFMIKVDFKMHNEKSGELEDNSVSPHYTVVPEKQTEYVLGKDALLEYLRINNKENTANLDEGKLQPAKLYFTINKKGEVTKISLDRTSGFKKIDNNLIKLMKKLPGKWIPAENLKGEKVEQELVISFGMVGC